MNNKILGFGLIVVGLIFILVIMTYQNQLNEHNEMSCVCYDVGDQCTMESSHWMIYWGVGLIGILISLGIYLIYFERSQKEIISTLENNKKIQVESEKFDILLKGLDEYEKVVILAIREQDGITQQTLRYRTDIHKTKLSIVLGSLERKGLIKRVPKGKTKKVFLRI